MSDSVKVAVRLRPFNSREKEIGSELVVQMNGPSTTITDPVTGQERVFTFDYSYNSFDANDANYATNQTLYDDLGKILLDNAWGGYNCCLFAYGQTGSGKSYSMVGYGSDRGIVPMVLENMFERIHNNNNPLVKYQVEASMMEIYNEKVRDLLNATNFPQGGLKVRDHPKLGPYVEDLSAAVATSYADVERLMAEGTAARTVASTNMNETSSRAHTIFQVVLTTTTHDRVTKKDTDTVSRINLVDLAGSERIAKTGATGKTLQEGVKINASLSALGNCIEKLARRAKDKKQHVPYRDSVLTWLLKQSLGGNSRTIMIAAISPASDNFEESLSTLRYADRAKQIKNDARVNEDENAQIIRALKQEIEMLRSQIKGPGASKGAAGETGNMTAEEQEEFMRMKERVEQNELIMKRLNKSWEEKMRETEQNAVSRALNLTAGSELRKTTPHLVNLHQDPLMAETLAYFFREGVTRVVRKDAEPAPGPNDIVLQGLQIQRDHAVVRNTGSSGGDVLITPGQDARVFVNGSLIKEPTELTHDDRVILGAHHTFRFVHPAQRPPPELDERGNEKRSRFDWQFAQKELAESTLSTLSPIVDEAAKREREEADRRLSELQHQIEEEKREAAEQERLRKLEFEQRLRELEEQREAELEEARHRVEQEKDSAAQAEMELRLREREEQLVAERREAEEEFARQQAELKQQQEELQAQLRHQTELTDQLRKKRETENRDRLLMEEALTSMIPMVNEAAAMAAELGRPLRFSVKLLAHKSSDVDAFTEKTDVYCRAEDTVRGSEALWDFETFTEQLFLMRELYYDYQQSNVLPTDWNPTPFNIRSDGPQLLGSSRIYLQPNFYLFPIDEKTPIIDYKGESMGQLTLRLVPVPASESLAAGGGGGAGETGSKHGSGGGGGEGGREEGEEEFFFDEESVEELVGEALELRLEIVKAMGLPAKLCSHVKCVYSFFLDPEPTHTEPSRETGINPVIGHKRTIVIDPVTPEFVEHLRSGLMEVQVWAEPPDAAQPVQATRVQEKMRVAQLDRIAELLDSSTGAAGQGATGTAAAGKADEAAAQSGEGGKQLSIAQQVEMLVKSHQQLVARVNESPRRTSRTESVIVREVEAKVKPRLEELEREVKAKESRVTVLEKQHPEKLIAEMKQQDAEIQRLQRLLNESKEAQSIQRLEKQNAELAAENARLKATQNNSKACTIL